MVQIKSRWTSAVLFECEVETIKEAVERAVKEGAHLLGAHLFEADLAGASLNGAALEGVDLRGANLSLADLRGADLVWADLRGAYLAGADIRGADLCRSSLSGAELVGARLHGAILHRADLDGVRVYWKSHDLIAEILRREAGGDLDKESYAGLVLFKREWCWLEHLEAKLPQLEWALRALAKWVQPDDYHPECLDAYAKDREANKVETDAGNHA